MTCDIGESLWRVLGQNRSWLFVCFRTKEMQKYQSGKENRQVIIISHQASVDCLSTRCRVKSKTVRNQTQNKLKAEVGNSLSRELVLKVPDYHTQKQQHAIQTQERKEICFPEYRSNLKRCRKMMPTQEMNSISAECKERRFVCAKMYRESDVKIPPNRTV